MASIPTSAEQQTTVLVLEDEEGLAELYTAWLSNEYSVRTAYSATEAREKIDEDVDVALIDRRLPDESGGDILDFLSQNHPQSRRAMVTAVNPDTDIVEMPLDDYLVKPIDRGELTETVRRLEKLPNGDGVVRELYAVTRKRAHLASELSEAERLDSEEFAWLESEIENLEEVAMDAHEQFDGGLSGSGMAPATVLETIDQMDSDDQTHSCEGHELIETESASVRHHEADEAYLAEHDWETDESLSATVAAIIEAISDGDSGARPPLYDSVNPDALDRLFEPVGGDERTRMAGRIVFPYRGFLVTVHADGEIEVHDGHDDSENQ